MEVTIKEVVRIAGLGHPASAVFYAALGEERMTDRSARLTPADYEAVMAEFDRRLKEIYNRRNGSPVLPIKNDWRDQYNDISNVQQQVSDFFIDLYRMGLVSLPADVLDQMIQPQ